MPVMVCLTLEAALKIEVRPDWWKDFFDRTYLVTDARSVENPRLTSQEVDLLIDLLKLEKSHRILDLCGGHGRHSLELGRRGYSHLTVLDYSRFLIEEGKRRASEEGIRIEFRKGDARYSEFEDCCYDAVFIMGNSLGYSSEEKDDFAMLREANRVLKGGGGFLLDLTDHEALFQNFKPYSCHQADPDTAICRIREIVGSVVRVREVVHSRLRGRIKDRCYSERVYSQEKIKSLLECAGFRNIEIKKGALSRSGKEDYGLMNFRTIVVAYKQR